MNAMTGIKEGEVRSVWSERLLLGLSYPVKICGKSVLGKGNSKRKSPEMGMSLACLRTRKANVAGRKFQDDAREVAGDSLYGGLEARARV